MAANQEPWPQGGKTHFIIEGGGQESSKVDGQELNLSPHLFFPPVSNLLNPHPAFHLVIVPWVWSTLRDGDRHQEGKGRGRLVFTDPPPMGALEAKPFSFHLCMQALAQVCANCLRS